VSRSGRASAQREMRQPVHIARLLRPRLG